jgi:hypothetical protein
MLRRISYTVMAVVVLATGYTGFTKLRYWERSVWIFKTGNSSSAFEGRGRGGRGDLSRPDGNDTGSNEDMSNMFRIGPGRAREGSDAMQPGSGRRMPRGRGENFRRPENLPGRSRIDVRPSPDSLGRDITAREGGFSRPGHEGEMRGSEHRERGGFQGGKQVRLRNVAWFLSVFAGFTVLTIYADKAVCLAGKGKTQIP